MKEDDRNYVMGDRSYPFGRAGNRKEKPKPEFAVVRELDFEISPDGKNLTIFYSKYTKDIYVKDDVELRKLLISLYDSNFPYETTKPPPPDDPFDSQLSLSNDNLRYMIFRLKDGRNWQFAREGWPITIGEAGMAYFYDAHRVDAKGVADKGDDRKLIRDGCMVAYVMAAADEVFAETGAYCHPINLHVDLFHEVQGQPTKKTCYLPIIIDPDVRYPGGSGQ